MDMMTKIGTGFTKALSWFAQFVEALTGPAADGPDLTALLDFFILGVVLAVIGWCVYQLKNITWGA